MASSIPTLGRLHNVYIVHYIIVYMCTWYFVLLFYIIICVRTVSSITLYLCPYRIMKITFCPYRIMKITLFVSSPSSTVSSLILESAHGSFFSSMHIIVGSICIEAMLIFIFMF